MLKHLYIKNFTIIDEISVELDDGLTVLTGETGAGKSILIDALQVVLGGRAESGLIKNGTDRCEVTAIFSLENNPFAQEWLKAQSLDEGQECLLRRVMNSDGRSRSTINGSPCSLQLLRELGDLLVHIHGQNQHQQLLKSDYQRELLDDYAGNMDLCHTVQNIYQQWREAKEQLAVITSQNNDKQKIFLEFQIRELAELELRANELSELEKEHRTLAHAEQWISVCQKILNILVEDDQSSVLHGLYTAGTFVKDLPAQNQTVLELLQQATIQTQEAVTHIRQTLKTLEPNPERMQWVEQRLARLHDVARKHRVLPEELITLQQNLTTQYEQLDQSAERIHLLEEKITSLALAYSKQANYLTQNRQKAAKKLNAAVTAQIQTLGMPGGRIEIQLIPRETDILNSHGNERIEFLVSTNPGQSLQALSKVVSGGELSRIALAIQVVSAQATILPTLIFDEVDVGIGGSTAEIVGQQLKNLGQRAQVLCVTHLPQVAAQGHQHLYVKKHTQDTEVKTEIQLLSVEEKIQEIARMLGGVKITERGLAHAREMVIS